MLLIFFLVTSSMDTDKGLPRQLPSPQDSLVVQELLVKKRNVMQIAIDSHDVLTLDGQAVTPSELTDRVAEFVANDQNDPALPEKSRREVHLLGLTEVSDRHILSIQVDRQTSYNAYFQMQNAIVAAYVRLRHRLALRSFGHGLRQCSAEEQDVLGMVFPQRISEAVPTEEGGGQ